MSYNLIFIDESESMQRAVSTIFMNEPDFQINIADRPSALFKIAKTYSPDVIVLSYNTIDTEIKKGITEIKTSKEFSNIPLILLVPSDLSDNERETLIKLKADGFIYRPFDKNSFISKIKRTLNIKSAGFNAAENIENSANMEEKIYDVEYFEKNDKKEEPSADTAVKNIEDKGVHKDEYNMKDGDKNDSGQKSDNELNIESSELSQAFENLFKDDAIFKEFQNINKKDGSVEKRADGYIIQEEPQTSVEEILPGVELVSNQSNRNEASDSNETFNEINTAHAEPIKQEEQLELQPQTTQIIGEIAGKENTEDIAKQDVSTSTIFNLNANEGLESSVSFDSIAENFINLNSQNKINAENIERNEETPIETPIETNHEADLGSNKNYFQKGELNLKILDEQNLIKLDEYLKDAIEKTIQDIKPQIIEIIKTDLPEIIERQVKEEIEKIKQL